MSSTRALFPGTFDPPTLGHLDIIGRCASLFAGVTVVVADHPTKDALLEPEERVRLLRECTAELEGVTVERWSGLVVDAGDRFGCSVIVRGARTGGDFEYEGQLAAMNRTLRPGIETALLVASSEHGHVSSTLVRQIARMGGDTSSLVPAAVDAVLRERCGG